MSGARVKITCTLREVVSTELALPIVIGVDLINENGPVLAAVPSQVPLPVAVNVEPPYRAPALNWRLPNGGADVLASPREVTRQAHVDSKQAWHHFLPHHDRPNLSKRTLTTRCCRTAI